MRPSARATIREESCEQEWATATHECQMQMLRYRAAHSTRDEVAVHRYRDTSATFSLIPKRGTPNPGRRIVGGTGPIKVQSPTDRYSFEKAVAAGTSHPWHIESG